MEKPETAKAKTTRSKRGWGNLYKRSRDGKQYPSSWKGKGNFYLAHWTGEKGKRKLVRIPLKGENGKPITNRAEAEAEQIRIMSPIKAGKEVEQLESRLEKAKGDQVKAVNESTGGMLISQAWENFIEYRKQKPKESTLRQYAVQWDMFQRWINEHYPDIETVEEVRRKHTREYWQHLADRGTSQGTRNKHKNLLSMVFEVLFKRKTQDEEDAQRDAGIDAKITPEQNPWDAIESGTHIQNIKSNFTYEQIRRIFGTAEGELQTLYYILFYTGIRLGDTATLQWQSVDFPKSYIRIIPSKTSRRGRVANIAMNPAIFELLAEKRTIAKGEYVLPELAELYNRRGADALTRRIQAHLWSCGIDCHKKGTGRQLKRDKLGNHIANENGTPEFIETGKRAVVEYGAHSFRHTFVTECRKSGVGSKVIEEMVGHSNPMMLNRYTHTSPEEGHKAVSMLPNLITEGDNEAPQERPQPRNGLLN